MNGYVSKKAYVSTHSRLKAAGAPLAKGADSEPFQHTAA